MGEAKRRVDRCLRRVLFERYKFGEHRHAVKRYLLLGQGDFHAFLMDLVGPVYRTRRAVSAYRLTGTLEAAIRSSNAQFDDADVLDRLRVRMMPHVGGDELGWGVFSLEYVFAPPSPPSSPKTPWASTCACSTSCGDSNAWNTVCAPRGRR